MKKITKKRTSKNKSKRLKKFIDSNSSLYSKFQEQSAAFKKKVVETIKQGVQRGFITEDELLYLFPFPERDLELLEDIFDLAEDSGAPINFGNTLDTLWSEFDDAKDAEERELAQKLSGNLAGDVGGKNLSDDAVWFLF